MPGPFTQEVAKSYKVAKALKASFNTVMYGKEAPDSTETSMKDVRLDKKGHAIICQHVYCAFVPEMSKKFAKKIAAEDWAAFDSEVRLSHVNE